MQAPQEMSGGVGALAKLRFILCKRENVHYKLKNMTGSQSAVAKQFREEESHLTHLSTLSFIVAERNFPRAIILTLLLVPPCIS